MEKFNELAYENADIFREKYKLGDYCAKDLLNIIDVLEEKEDIKIKLIRKPLDDDTIDGFIGYKYSTFVIVINTNKTLGNERFTIAHEIYHLLNHRNSIKENAIIEENNRDRSDNIVESMANAFAVQLLMPKKSITENLRVMLKDESTKIDMNIVVKLQHKYGVDYKAITKRLYEIGEIKQEEQIKLDEYIINPNKLEVITKNLGYDNILNLPSKDTYLLQRDLDIIRKNHESGEITYDDLIRIFSYLGCSPEKFGYQEDIQLSDEALDFMKSLLE